MLPLSHADPKCHAHAWSWLKYRPLTNQGPALPRPRNSRGGGGRVARGVRGVVRGEGGGELNPLAQVTSASYQIGGEGGHNKGADATLLRPYSF